MVIYDIAANSLKDAKLDNITFVDFYLQWMKL